MKHISDPVTVSDTEQPGSTPRNTRQTILPFSLYLSSHGISLCVMLIALTYLSIILYLLKASLTLSLVLLSGFIGLILSWLFISYYRHKKRLRFLFQKLDLLPEQYLAGELMEAPENVVEKQYFDILRRISRSAIHTVEQAEREKQDYCEYVESWVHEIKTPLTACSLILDTDADRTKLKQELKRADNQTENILYYARLRSSEKDFQISEVSLHALLEEALRQEMELLIAAGISVGVEGDAVVPTDPKLLSFIVKQLLINCAKYCQGCHIRMTAAEHQLIIEDNGPGIPAHELPRVTQRGFTGAEWRTAAGGTGMGLYIVSELCQKMNLRLSITSVEGAYTRFTFDFPI